MIENKRNLFYTETPRGIISEYENEKKKWKSIESTTKKMKKIHKMSNLEWLWRKKAIQSEKEGKVQNSKYTEKVKEKKSFNFFLC